MNQPVKRDRRMNADIRSQEPIDGESGGLFGAAVVITDRPERRDGSLEAESPVVPRQAAPTVLRSESLFGREREVLILHAGEVYRLRLTKNGKLLLTK